MCCCNGMVRQNLSFKIDEVFITVLSLPIEKICNIKFYNHFITIYFKRL